MFSVVEFINSEKVALKLVLRSGSPLLLTLVAFRLVTLGEVVSTEKVRSAGVASSFPASTSALTSKV